MSDPHREQVVEVVGCRNAVLFSYLWRPSSPSCWREFREGRSDNRDANEKVLEPFRTGKRCRNYATDLPNAC